jgi:hypothetical protein
MSNGTDYSLIFQNQSSNAGTAMVFQKDPGLGPNVLPLAWFTQYAFPTTSLTFTWQVNYSFTWSQTGVLIPGVVFSATQNWAADLSMSNQVTFSHPGPAYTFTNQTAGPAAGSLFIVEDSTLPLKDASVGIGMSGSGTFAVQAQPNLNLAFTPHPEYWIAFGNYTKGQVLDIQQITKPQILAFPPNVFSLTAILTIDNKWVVKPTAKVNEEFVRAKQDNAKALWGEVA